MTGADGMEVAATRFRDEGIRTTIVRDFTVK
jgi:hypothetical protein